jgi:hypothetical protein
MEKKEQPPLEKKEEAPKTSFNSQAKPFVPNQIPYYYPYVYYPQYCQQEEEEQNSESSESENEMERLNQFYSEFFTASKDCPCCKGYVNACKGKICKDLGECYCRTVRETEVDINKSIEK